MRASWFAVMAVAVGCCAMQCQSTKQRSSVPESTEPAHRPVTRPVRPVQSSTVMLTKELERCEDQLEALTKSDPDTKNSDKVKTKTRLKVVNGPPKKCTQPTPVIKPVETTNCQSGMVCLDEKAQATLARNLAAYEAWMTRVTSCENEP